MGLPLIGGIIAGIGRAGYGAYAAKKQSNANKNTIKRAYEVADQKMGTDQAIARQNINESLNSRGILTAGGVGQVGQTPIQAAMTDHGPGAVDLKVAGQMYTKAGANSLGSSNTLSGQVNRDTTDSMYVDRYGLYQDRQDALKQNAAQLSQGYVNAAAGGVNTGASIYAMGKSGGASAAQIPEVPGAPSVSNSTGASTYTPGPMSPITGAYNLPANVNFATSNPTFTDSNVAAPGQQNATFSQRGPQP